MALVIFKNLPDTSTPLNAENLNNNFKKNIMTAKGLEDITTGNNTNEKITLESRVVVGDKLTISDGGVKIGSGVSYVKVSGALMFSTISGVDQRHHLYIRKNNSGLATATGRLRGTWETLSTSTVLTSVSENDIIYLYVRTQDGAGAVVNASACILTVEVVQ